MDHSSHWQLGLHKLNLFVAPENWKGYQKITEYYIYLDLS